MSQTPEALQPPHDFQRLEDMLRKDTWSVHEGLFEIVRDKVKTLSGKDAEEAIRLYRRLVKIWESGVHPAERLPPAYFVLWADKKRYLLSWATWARQEGWLDDRATVTNLRHVRNKATAKQGIASARAALVASSDQVDAMPYMTDVLRAAAQVMRENWIDYDPNRLPKQDFIAREIDKALGASLVGDKPTRTASVLAAAIQPDEIKAADKRRNLKVG